MSSIYNMQMIHFSRNGGKRYDCTKAKFNMFTLNNSEAIWGHGYNAGTDKEAEREQIWVGILTPSSLTGIGEAISLY